MSIKRKFSAISPLIKHPILLIKFFYIRKKGSFNSQSYLYLNPDVAMAGVNPLVHYLKYGKREGRMCIQQRNTKNTVNSLINSFFGDHGQFKYLLITDKIKRINIIFTGFESDSFFGGKATALRLAISFANQYEYTLRIIVLGKLDKEVFCQYLKTFNLQRPSNVEFIKANGQTHIDVSSDDIFLCTMWNNLKLFLNMHLPNRVFYIMQEVETFFYDHGDTHLETYLTLSNPSVYPIVNTKLLFDYLCNANYDNVKKQGVFFEPAFPKKQIKINDDFFLKKKERYKLFFFARPGHQRNLFYFCLDVLNRAFELNILNPNEWEVYMAGDNTVPLFEFDNNEVIIYQLGIMTWQEYYEFIPQIDLCFSVIYTPHPSYPPFDFASSGAVVLTNKCFNKQSLSMYSENIICADLTIDEMLLGFKKALTLVKDLKQREINFKNNNIINSWDQSFNDILTFMKNKI